MAHLSNQPECCETGCWKLVYYERHNELFTFKLLVRFVMIGNDI